MYKLSLLPLKSRERSKRTFEIKLISNSNSSFQKSQKKKKKYRNIPFPSVNFARKKNKSKGRDERGEKLNF